VLFVIFFFRHGLLHIEFRSPTFAIQFFDYIAYQLELFIKQNEIAAAVFLLRMDRLTRDFVPAEKQSQIADIRYSDKLRELLAIPKLDALKKSLVYAELLSSFARRTDMSEQEIFDLLVGTAHLYKFPVPSSLAWAETQKEVQDAMVQHADAARNYLLCLESEGAAAVGGKHTENSSTKINKIVRALDFQVDDHRGDWEIHEPANCFPVFTLMKEGNEAVQYFPMRGAFVSLDATVQLPEPILENPHFRQLFPKITQAQILPGEVYKIVKPDIPQAFFYVKVTNMRLAIEAQTKDQSKPPLCFVPESLLEYDKKIVKPKGMSTQTLVEKHSALGSLNLNKNFEHWLNLADRTQMLVVKPGTLDVCCTVELRERSFWQPDTKVNKTVRMDEGLALFRECDFFSTIEYPDYVEGWFNEKNELAHLILPRFNLSFRHKLGAHDEGSPLLALRCEQFDPGHFYLAREQVWRSLAAIRMRYFCRILRDNKKSCYLDSGWPLETKKNLCSPAIKCSVKLRWRLKARKNILCLTLMGTTILVPKTARTTCSWLTYSLPSRNIRPLLIFCAEWALNCLNIDRQKRNACLPFLE